MQAIEEAEAPSARVAVRTRLVLVLLILAATIGCDRATKLAAEESLRGAGRLSYFSDLFRLEYARNTGAFLSLGARLPEPARSALLIGGVAVISAVLVALALRRRNKAETIALALFAGGGIGNLWDRIGSGGVIDFMNLGIGGLRTGIFNVADLAIIAGAALLSLAARRARHEPAAAAPPAGDAPV